MKSKANQIGFKDNKIIIDSNVCLMINSIADAYFDNQNDTYIL